MIEIGPGSLGEAGGAGNGPAGSTKPPTGAATSSSAVPHRLKQWRGIATRYDKRSDRYLAAVTLASTLIWLGT